MKRVKLLLVSVILSASCVAATKQAATSNRNTSAKSIVRTIRITRPNIEITGAHLVRVEIWLEPTGTGIGEALVGEAKRLTPPGDRERWVFPIASLPGYPHPIMAANAFAKGYDRKGEVGRKSLGFHGVSEFNTALTAVKIPTSQK
jgi:hypothetical protein